MKFWKILIISIVLVIPVCNVAAFGRPLGRITRVERTRFDSIVLRPGRITGVGGATLSLATPPKLAASNHEALLKEIDQASNDQFATVHIEMLVPNLNQDKPQRVDSTTFYAYLREYGQTGVSPAAANLSENVGLLNSRQLYPSTYLSEHFFPPVTGRAILDFSVKSESLAPKEHLYKLKVGGQPPMFVDTPREISDFLNKVAKDKGTDRIYLFTESSRGKKDIEALRMSLMAQQNTLIPRVSMLKMGYSKPVIHTIFLPGARIEATEPQSLENGLWTSSIKSFNRGYQTTVRVIFKSLEAALKFMDHFNIASTTGRLAKVSLAVILLEARAEVKRTLDVADDAVKIEIEDQMENIQFVTISQQEGAS
jgi:hypothetical protein